jgi:alpha-tubulin suppressor-like RCC1 family protein
MNGSPIPVQVTALGYAATIAAGYQYSLALYYSVTTYTIYAWGINNSGQLGNGTTTASATPLAVSGIATPIAIAAGHDHAVALNSDGAVYAWGNNANGQLGNGTTTNSAVAAPVEGLTGGISIAAGTRNCFALKTDGTLWAWGRNDHGQLGDGTATDRMKPFQVP